MGWELNKSSPKFSQTLCIVLASWHDVITSWGCRQVLPEAEQSPARAWCLFLLRAVGFLEFPPLQVPLGAGLPPNPHPAGAWEHPASTKREFLHRERHSQEKASPAPPVQPLLLLREGWVPT